MTSLDVRAPAAETESVFVAISAAAARHGAVNLAQGVPDHGPPDLVLDALARVRRGTEHQYAPSPGHPTLREALARETARHDGATVDPDHEVTVTAGATEGLHCTLAALLRPGDEAVLVEPAYEQYAPVVRGLGGRVVPVVLDGPDSRLEADALAAACTERTRVIVVNSPWNPLGRPFAEDEWRAVAEVAAERDLVVVSDETYEHLMLDGTAHRGVLAAVDDPERRVKISSASKALCVTGWRIGWTVAGPSLTRRIRAIHQFVTFCPATPLQLAVADVLDDAALPDLFAEGVARIATGTRRFVDALGELGLAARMPTAGFFVVADVGGDVRAWCDRMLVDQGVAALPMSVFFSGAGGADAPPPMSNHVRFALCKRHETIDEAIRRLRDRLAPVGAAEPGTGGAGPVHHGEVRS